MKCSEEAGELSRRHRRRDYQAVEANQVAKALKFVQVGELFAGRQALEGAELAPGTTAMSTALRIRPTPLLDSILELPRDLTVFNLDEVFFFGKNVRSGRKGAAGGPSGTTHDHLRPLLECPKDLHLLFIVCDLFAKVPRGASFRNGKDDSTPGGRERRARHGVRRIQQKSHSQDLAQR